MLSRYPGSCSCCGRRYGAGAELVRGAAGWALASCQEPRGRAPAAPGSDAEVLEVLERAKVVARSKAGQPEHVSVVLERALGKVGR